MQQMSFRTQPFDDMPVIKCRGKKNRSKPDYPPTLPHPGRPVHLARDEAARASSSSASSATASASRSMDERRFILLIHESGEGAAVLRPHPPPDRRRDAVAPGRFLRFLPTAVACWTQSRAVPGPVVDSCMWEEEFKYIRSSRVRGGGGADKTSNHNRNSLCSCRSFP